jgi:hypothetical protein
MAEDFAMHIPGGMMDGKTAADGGEGNSARPLR